MLSVTFFASGFAALLYQVVWQRALFGIFGVNIESVTVVVTAFMLGLGVGSLVGGALSKNPKRPALLMFGLAELGIGVFGALSLPLFAWVGDATLEQSLGVTAAVAFLLTLLPTTLMGGTLPLLVAHRVRQAASVGESVGQLYFVNTLGSAFASVASVLVLLRTLGAAHTTHVAAATNLVIGAIAVITWVRSR